MCCEQYQNQNNKVDSRCGILTKNRDLCFLHLDDKCVFHLFCGLRFRVRFGSVWSPLSRPGRPWDLPGVPQDLPKTTQEDPKVLSFERGRLVLSGIRVSFENDDHLESKSPNLACCQVCIPRERRSWGVKSVNN